MSSNSREIPADVMRVTYQIMDALDFGPEPADIAAVARVLMEQQARWIPVVREIEQERTRQQDSEGWTAQHDDQWKRNELPLAAACYAAAHVVQPDWIASLWPWSAEWWKPTNRRRNLIKAAALIVAEIDRIDRQPLPPSPTTEGE